MGKKPEAKEIICFCNNVARDVIEKAILEGAKTLNEIYDKTTAGIGPCGGSCRRKIGPILEKYLETGKLPESQDSAAAEKSKKAAEMRKKNNPYDV